MQDEGYVAALLYPEGTKDIELGKILAIIVDSEEDIAAFANYTAEDFAGAPAAAATPAAPEPVAAAAPTPAQPAAAAASTPTPAPAAHAGRPAGERIFASPIAQSAATAAGIDLALVSGTGPNGRIIKADIEDAIANGVSSPVAAPQEAA